MLFFYGAYGFTGRQIFDFFRSNFPLQSKKIIISGRNKEKLDDLKQKLKNEFPQLDVLPATPFDLQTKKIDGIKLVVNTAGPFSDTGESVLNFAIENGANYIDCTGEWNWTKKIIDNYDKVLRERKLFASSGVAWETVSGEICVKELVDKLKQEGKISDVKKNSSCISCRFCYVSWNIEIFSENFKKRSYKMGIWKNKTCSAC